MEIFFWAYCIYILVKLTKSLQLNQISKQVEDLEKDEIRKVTLSLCFLTIFFPGIFHLYTTKKSEYLSKILSNFYVDQRMLAREICLGWFILVSGLWSQLYEIISENGFLDFLLYLSPICQIISDLKQGKI